MRQLNIHNLRVSVDAFRDNANSEAFEVIAAINNAIEKVNGSPALVMNGPVNADYEEINDE